MAFEHFFGEYIVFRDDVAERQRIERIHIMAKEYGFGAADAAQSGKNVGSGFAEFFVKIVWRFAIDALSGILSIKNGEFNIGNDAGVRAIGHIITSFRSDYTRLEENKQERHHANADRNRPRRAGQPHQPVGIISRTTHPRIRLIEREAF